jgi:hypothetical protein
MSTGHDCTRSHPHEEMSKECELRTEIARLTNQGAHLQALNAELAAALERLIQQADEGPRGCYGRDSGGREDWKGSFHERIETARAALEKHTKETA